MRNLLLASMPFVLLLASSSAHASFINAASTGIASPTTTITFDEVVLPFQTVITNQYSSYGVSFSPYAVYEASEVGNLGGLQGHYVGNFFPGGSALQVESIVFSAPVSGATFALFTQSGTTSFKAYFQNNLVEEMTVSTGTGGLFTGTNGKYYGFENITFDRIDFQVTSSDHASIFDTIQFQTVPEPSSFALVGLGGISLVIAACRRR